MYLESDIAPELADYSILDFVFQDPTLKRERRTQPRGAMLTRPTSMMLYQHVTQQRADPQRRPAVVPLASQSRRCSPH